MIQFRFALPLFICFFSLASANEIQFDENTPIPDILNSAKIIQQYRLNTFKGLRFSRKLKVAVLDNGFGGYLGQVGKGLPSDTVYDPGASSGADRVKFASLHGTLMAKILSHIIQISGAQADYELHLFNTFGYTKFEYAVNQVIAGRFDVVLFAQTWETGGNGDTHGFINALVTKATQAGVIWINASGEHGGEMRVDPIQLENRSGEQWVRFKNKKGEQTDGITVECRAPVCKMEISAIWNDINDNPDIGSDKDLDMFLYEQNGKIVTSSQKRQQLTEDPRDANVSIIPRESIKWDVKTGRYLVKFKAHSGGFNAAADVLRTIATGPGVQLEDATFDETLFPPADNPSVISIGASDDPTSSRSVKLHRPDVYLISHVDLKGKNNLFGYSSSMASAIGAGITVLKLGTGTAATRESVLAELKKLGSDKPPKVPARPLNEVASQPTRTNPTGAATSPVVAQSPSSPRCYQAASLPYLYRAVSQLLAVGGKPIIYHGRLLIAVTPEYAKRNGLTRPASDLWWFVTPRGIQAFSGDEIRAGLPPEYYLIGYTDIPLCG